MSIVTVLIALFLVFIAWKILVGLVKIAAIVLIVGLAAMFLFGGIPL